MGQFTANLERAGLETTQRIYVVTGLERALLGLPAIEALEVVSATINQVQSYENTHDVAKTFPELFKGLGRFRDNYKITVKSGAVPYALTTPRRVPLPLLPK